MALSRAHRFACLVFESGGYNLDSTEFKEVIAISTRNSLYISEVLLDDPFFDGDTNEVHHVMGNVNKTGVVMMVAPLAPRVRSAELNRWKQISHSLFNQDREDCFRAISLHLSFTDFEIPFDIGQRGSIDRDIYVRVIETVIAVYNRADWVADLDASSYTSLHFTETDSYEDSTSRRGRHHRLPGPDLPDWRRPVGACPTTTPDFNRQLGRAAQYS